jgi:hypothetical protein
MASHTGSSADLLRMLAQRFLRLLDSDLTAVPKLVVAESGNFPAIAQFYADVVLRRAFRLVEGILTRGMERGEFRRMDVHATLPLFAAPFLLLALWKHSLGRHTDLTFDPRAVAEAHIDVLLRGLAPDRP